MHELSMNFRPLGQAAGTSAKPLCNAMPREASGIARADERLIFR
jgi:hypothetical protein